MKKAVDRIITWFLDGLARIFGTRINQIERKDVEHARLCNEARMKISSRKAYLLGQLRGYRHE